MEYTDIKVSTSADGTAASLTTNIAGANNDLVFTANNAGTDGNDITVEYTVPADDNQAHAIDVTVTGTDIVVQLAVDTDGSTITSTAADIKTAIEADNAADALVSVANKAANDGTGLAVVMAAAPLAGGANVEASTTSNVAPGELRGLEVIWHADTPDGATVTVSNLGRQLLTAAPRTDGDDVFYPVAEEMVDAAQAGASAYQRFVVSGDVVVDLDLGDIDANDDTLDITDAVIVRMHLVQ